MVLGWVKDGEARRTGKGKGKRDLVLKAVPDKLRHFSAKDCVAFVSAKILAYVCGNEVQLCNAASGDVVAVLRKHDAAIVSVCAADWSSLELISCDTTGMVCVWDIKDAKCLRSFEATGLERVVGGSYAVLGSTETGNASGKGGKRRGATSTEWQVVKVDLSGTKVKVVRTLFETDQAAKAPQAASCVRSLAAGNDSNANLVVAISGRDIYVHDTSENDPSASTTILSLESLVSAVSIHPREPIIAVGDVVGHIILFRRSGDSYEQSVNTQLHWHFQCVETLAFSIDGAHFFSGGQEGTVVMWQLETGARSFLPRVGDQIDRIAVSLDGSRFGVALKNATCRIVDARTKETGPTFKGWSGKKPMALKGISSVADERYGIVIEPRSGASVVQLAPGELSFIANGSRHGRVIASLDVTSHNVVSSVSKDRQLRPSYVQKIAFAQLDGRRMVTVDRRGMGNSSLKFWVLDRSAAKAAIGREYQSKGSDKTKATNTHGKYELTTHVDQPHSSQITAVLMDARGELCVTASLDGSFKVWTLEPGAGKWSCHVVGLFRDGVPIHCAALSGDGSLLALASNNIVSLWNPRSNKLLATLAHPAIAGGATSIAFYRQNLLAVATKKSVLFVWDVLRRKLEWQLRIKREALSEPGASSDGDSDLISAIAPLGSSKLMVAANGQRLLVFGAGREPEHILHSNRTKKKITGVAFIPQTNHFVYSLGMDRVERFQREPHVSEVTDTGGVASSEGSGNWDLIKASTKLVARAEDIEAELDQVHKQLELAKSSSAAFKALDSYPSYVLPPLAKLVKSLVSLESTTKHIDTPKRKSKAQEAPEPPSLKKQRLLEERDRALSSEPTLATDNSVALDESLEKEYAATIKKNAASLFAKTIKTK